MLIYKNKNGQAVSSEYVMVFFLIVATITFMSTYVKRTFQARLYDAKETMADLAEADICQYEPYYKNYHTVSPTTINNTTSKVLDHGTFTKTVDSTIQSNIHGDVLAPAEAAE